MRLSRFLLALGLLSAAARCEDAFAQTTYTWVNAGVGNWNDGANWNAGFVPDIQFSELGAINNGGTAFLETPNLTAPGAVILGQGAADSGFLELRRGGAMNIVAGGTGVTGALTVGQSGRGDARLLNGSALSAASLGMGGNAANTFSMEGTSSLTLTGAANLARQSRITGPNVTFNAASLSIPATGRHTAVITGATHSPMNISGAATLAGNLTVELSGVAPTVGDSWTLIDAVTLNGQFASVTIGDAPALPRGRNYKVDYNEAGNGNAVLEVKDSLILTVNRSSGELGLENAIGGAVQLTGYAIQSANGILAPAGWESLESSGDAGPGWGEANPQPTHLAELNVADAYSMTVGNKLDLGAGLALGARPAQEDLKFTYTNAAGEIVEGSVEYTGPVNDLVLRVDPTSGQAVLRNLSQHIAPDVTGYTITSASGSLSPETWTSLDESGLGGAGWAIANPTETHLAELNLTSSTLFSTNKSLSLGDIFASGGSQDLVLQYTTIDNQILTGTVEFGEISTPVVGDTNGDGEVNLDDLNNVRNNFGGTGLGDTNGDGEIDLDDLNNVRNNFGATSGGSQAVPEPGTLALLGIGGVAIVALRRRGRR